VVTVAAHRRYTDPGMACNPYQHIDLRVNDLERAWRFYSKILPPIGFPEGWQGENFRGFDAPGKLPDKPWFGFVEDKQHKPNRNRIAFTADSPEQVDAVGAMLEGAGARNVSGPRACPEYTPTYYAVFFEDPFGNRLEICYRGE
jgi:catechol 2,3-dioxygenase-like lactoylglutathione lyase family enzyme